MGVRQFSCPWSLREAIAIQPSDFFAFHAHAPLVSQSLLIIIGSLCRCWPFFSRVSRI